jgi:hypothetical protein
MVPQVTVATWTHVSPFPERVGMSGVEPFELLTQARIRLFAVGLMLAVVHEVASVVLPPVVCELAVTAAIAVPGRTISEQVRIAAQTTGPKSIPILRSPFAALGGTVAIIAFSKIEIVNFEWVIICLSFKCIVFLDRFFPSEEMNY